MCSPRKRDDAILARALEAYQAGHYADALIGAEYVCRRYPLKSIPAILRAHILQTAKPELASRAWQAAWQADAENPMLQDQLLQHWLRDGAQAEAASLGPAFLPARCMANQHAGLLPLLRDAGVTLTGACWKQDEAIEGMVFSFTGAAQVQLLLSDETRQWQYTVPANGQRFRLPCPYPQGVWSLALAQDGAAPQLLPGSPLAFYPLPALVAPAEHGAPQGKRPAVSIVIPVYRDIALVQACIGSVLASLPRNRTPAKIVVVDDASPEPALSAWLDTLAAGRKITLLRNPRNLGFIEAVNRGLRQHPQHDVLLLNADTLVHGDWIDRLGKSLYSAPDIASVSPWSNNGEITSFPTIAQAAPAPDAAQLARIDQAAAALRAQGQTDDVELPSCCGFAMLIRRRVLDQVGMLDGAGMVRGYNEEVDWCMRARAAGWRHLAAVGVFIGHAGTVSFGAEKTLRVAQNRTVINTRYPGYQKEYARFKREDPLRSARQALSALLAPARNAGMSALEVLAEDGPVTSALVSATARIAVWNHRTDSRYAGKILQLARAIASQPQLRLRMLVIGDVSEMLWHTGVVDGVSAVRPDAKVLLDDRQLLELTGNAVVLSEEPGNTPATAPMVMLSDEFDATTWLADWVTSNPTGLAA
ncbi:glycosyltransferase family 2 protein [Pseudoduganella rhizocola]|uniref:glycosyltransferase family 2 protein n=1 Tax=Pseudoduganella rhizocola TaxID=3382643 RepID=UPI0038B56281